MGKNVINTQVGLHIPLTGGTPNVLYTYSRTTSCMHVESPGITPAEWKANRDAADVATGQVPWLAAMPSALTIWMNAQPADVRTRFFQLDCTALPAGI